ncbi:recombination regulator RecX [Streptomyces sp. Amel2xB2]|uniref:recombination regulator RecX n=1 Tax=Streptomyces sp. Amel2xB2 TaxID=1305829 RepID=UPI0015EC3F2B|nr:recombination regulator RecX [Streptomyces sp. Amel2xB2]
MTRRTNWPVHEDSGGPTSSRAEVGSPRTTRTSRAARGRTGGGPRARDGAPPDDEERESADATGEADGDTDDGDEDGGAARAGSPHTELDTDPAERARAICLRLLTGTPRTRRQLADALRKREIPDEAAEEVLSRFEEAGLIDDVAFADAWVESRHHSRGLARRALARELRTKGVEAQVIEGAVGQLDAEQEEETARALVEAKLRSTRGLESEKRIRRLAGMLARRGYGEGLALHVVRRALEEEGDDAEILDRYLPED